MGVLLGQKILESVRRSGIRLELRRLPVILSELFPYLSHENLNVIVAGLSLVARLGVGNYLFFENPFALRHFHLVTPAM